MIPSQPGWCSSTLFHAKGFSLTWASASTVGVRTAARYGPGVGPSSAACATIGDATGTEQGADVALEIQIDRETCMGSGNCSFWAPGVFELDDDGISTVLDVDGESKEKIVLAAQGCPTQAIVVLEDGEKIA